MTTRTPPDWAHWRLMPSVAAWEAAALSLNIEPTSIKPARNNWMAGGVSLGSRAFEGPPDFMKRLDVILLSIGHEGQPLKRQDYEPGPITQARVALNDFAGWAAATGWELPSELLALAPSPHIEVPKQELSTRERDTLLKIVLGMAIGGYAYDPKAVKSDAAKTIEGDCQANGLGVTDDTIRKYLKEAVKHLPGK